MAKPKGVIYAPMPETPPMRNCTDCGQVDSDPRHTTVLADQSEHYHHLDCGARRNPPCDTCAPQLEGWDGNTGDGLRKHLMGGK